MANRNKFLFIDIKDEQINRLLSSLRAIFCGHDSSTTNIHITVRGPQHYFNFAALEENIKKYEAENRCLKIGGVGRFNNPDSHIIYIKVDCGDLKKYGLWEKSDYKGNYNPHITLYNGSDKDRANVIYDFLKSIDFHRECSNYEFRVHTRDQRSFTLGRKAQITVLTKADLVILDMAKDMIGRECRAFNSRSGATEGRLPRYTNSEFSAPNGPNETKRPRLTSVRSIG
uniref:2'-5' RNA ligase n=1 Tax=Candidatus Kentrum sp. LFY TaxID=2126342 RepID=A0A450UQ19_9GAMM|nr:MAG: 2'-5' RNA ligase [Candidatus Kentron sp. LFY]